MTRGSGNRFSKYTIMFSRVGPALVRILSTTALLPELKERKSTRASGGKDGSGWGVNRPRWSGAQKSTSRRKSDGVANSSKSVDL